MTITAKQKAILKGLKKKLVELQKSEEETRAQMRVALNKIQKLGMAYQSKLAKKSKEIQRKIASAQASGYGKAFSDIEKRVKKHLRSKMQTIVAKLCQIDKKKSSPKRSKGKRV